MRAARAAHCSAPRASSSGAAVEEADGRRRRARRARAHSTDRAGGASGAQQAQRDSHRLRQRVSARLRRATRRRRPAGAPASSRFATMLENVRAEAKPTGAAITLTGNGELDRRIGDAARRRHAARRALVSERPIAGARRRVRRARPGIRGARRSRPGVVPTTRVTVDLLRPATYRVTPPEEGEKEFTILFEEDVQPLAHRTAPNPAGFVASLDPIDALLTRGGLGAASALDATGCGGCVRLRCAARGRGAGPFAQVPQQGAIPQLPPQRRRRRARSSASPGIRSASISRAPTCARCCARSPRSAASTSSSIRRAGHGRRGAARRAVGSGARHHPARQQARLLGRRHDRPHRAADACWPTKKRSAASWPTSRRSSGELRGADAAAQLREGRQSCSRC